MDFEPFNDQVRKYLEEEIKILDKTGGISKIESLTSEDLNDYLVNLYNYDELDSFVLKNDDDSYDLFLRYKSLDTKIEIGNVIESAKEAYKSENYDKSLSKILLVLRKAAYPKSEVYDIAGLIYNAKGEFEKGNDYIRIANYMEGKKEYNKVDINEVRERVEEKMKKAKKSNYNQYNFDMDNREIHIDKLTLPDLDKIIEYVEKKHINLETAGKELNLTNEEIDFIKLIYAREFYKQGDIEKGNYYLKSVEESSGKTSDVTRLCLEARTNKKFFQYRDNNQPRKLSLVRTAKRK